MRTLTIKPRLHDTIISAKGLSIKAAGYAGHHLCKEGSDYYISNDYKTNPRTAQISVPALTKYLKELLEDFHFDKIKIKGRYEINGDELFKLVSAD